MLRGRYFRNGDFLNAPLGSNASLVWKSIVWGRDLFKEGFRWRVGNENYIYIDQDPWIPRKGSRFPLVVPREWQGRKVKKLINPAGEWDENLIKQIFTPSDVDDILAIPLGLPEEKDKIIWNVDSKGLFSMKSAYHMASNLQQTKEASASGNGNTKGPWQNIWKLNIIPKAKIGLWKISKNLVPTKENLIAKGLDINPICDLCRKSREDINHVMWSCKQVKQIWMELFLNLMYVSSFCRKEIKMSECWEEISRSLSKEKVEQIAIAQWTIWNFRNKVTINKEQPDFTILKRWIRRNLIEQTKRTSNLPDHRAESLRNHELWIPPTNCLKMNSDASWNEDLKLGGIGWVVRDSAGSLLGAG